MKCLTTSNVRSADMSGVSRTMTHRHSTIARGVEQRCEVMKMKMNKYGGILDVERPDSRTYNLWYGMLRRCYDEDQHKREKGEAYKDCVVCERWMKFSLFDKDIRDLPGYRLWATDGNMQLDKDILGFGSKEYNPRNCCFVPSSVNMAFMNRTHPNITHNANEANKTVYILQKENETLVFEEVEE